MTDFANIGRKAMLRAEKSGRALMRAAREETPQTAAKTEAKAQHEIEIRGRYNANISADGIAVARLLVEAAKARADVALIRVRFPGGGVRTFAFEGGGWVGSL